MTEKIINGITDAIKTVFGETDYKVYTENAEQGFDKPCFFIALKTQKHNLELGTHFKIQYSFDIQFYPKTANLEQCESVAENLYSILEYIEADGGILRGTSMNSKTEEGILHFYVDYVVTGYVKSDDEFMEEVKYFGRVKKD